MARFVPAKALKVRYCVFGHFYRVEFAPNKVAECRSVLEIVENGDVPEKSSDLCRRKPDAIFIMMNPGSSRPLTEANNFIRAGMIHKLPISLVPTKPDTTQYQVMRLMRHCEWGHVRVLNLSDLRCPKSNEFFEQFNRLEQDDSFDSHSIFSIRRRNELISKLTRHDDILLICAWGVSAKLDPLIERCTSRIAKCTTIKGLKKEGTTNKFLHPLPSLQSQKVQWVNRMVKQLQR